MSAPLPAPHATRAQHHQVHTILLGVVHHRLAHICKLGQANSAIIGTQDAVFGEGRWVAMNRPSMQRMLGNGKHTQAVAGAHRPWRAHMPTLTRRAALFKAGKNKAGNSSQWVGSGGDPLHRAPHARQGQASTHAEIATVVYVGGSPDAPPSGASALKKILERSTCMWHKDRSTAQLQEGLIEVGHS